MGMVLLAAAVFAAAGCTAPASPGPAPEKPVAASTAPAASGTRTSAPPSSAHAAEPSAAPAAARPGPPAPSGAAAAPAPSFAPAEQRFLASRVPKGTDPNAVLQVGQERCTRLEAVKAADRKAVVSHLIEERDSEETAAIAELCPGLKPELAEAGRGFPDGDFSIGAPAPKAGAGTVAAGTYEAWNPSAGCTLTAYDAAGNTVVESNGSAVVIPARATRVVSDGCYTWLAS